MIQSAALASRAAAVCVFTLGAPASAQVLYELIIDTSSTLVDVSISGSGSVSVPFQITIFNPVADVTGDPIGGSPANSLFTGFSWSLTNTTAGGTISGNRAILGNDGATDVFGPAGHSGSGLLFFNGDGYSISGSGTIDLADFGRTAADLNVGTYALGGSTVSALGGGSLVIRQIPAPGTGVLAVVGLVAVHRRRR